MAHMDIFKDDAFTMGQLIGMVHRIPYKPRLLGQLNLFEEKPVATLFASIEEKDHVLTLIPSSLRGAPLPTAATLKRRLRRVDTVRLAKGDRINASEVQSVRADGSETELKQVQDLVFEKQGMMRDDMELTWEYHRLGAVQGKVLDADGSVITDWFAKFNLSKPAAINFMLDATGTELQRVITDAVIRPMMRASKGAWIEGQTYVMALCGDDFYDKLTNHPAVQKTYLNWLAAKDMRGPFGPSNATIDGSFAGFIYGGVVWVNYRGVDSFDNGATSGINSIGVKSNTACFFPVNAPGVFQVVLSPGETFDTVNQRGTMLYPMIILDQRANPRWVDVELYSYPLFMCTRPEMLMNAVESA